MNYKETLHYLYTHLPMFQRIGSVAYKADLTNITKLMARINNPENTFKSIHVAGTNGKGSSSHMLASILQEAGYKTGLYTSPHLKSFTERIRINGVPIFEDSVVHFINRIKPLVKEINPSFFEITVALAFDYFSKNKVDIAIIEVGLGGRLDSTNIITPEISLITNIGLDHQALLGDTLEEIAEEKSGIIKQSVPVVISQKQKSVMQIFKNKAKQIGTSITFATDKYAIKQNPIDGYTIYLSNKILIKNLLLDLKGSYQELNLLGVLQTLELLNDFKITKKNIQTGLKHIVTNTHLKGRWQIIGKKPTIISDIGHNKDAMHMILKQLNSYSYTSLHIVLGMVKDKLIEDTLSIMPKSAHYYFCAADIPRSLPPSILREKASNFGLSGKSYTSVKKAFNTAKKNTPEEGLIFIGGSTFVVGEIDNL